MVDRNSLEPLHIQIKNDIIAAIENGTIKIGDKLMSESEMRQYYGVGRMTIRSALSELVAEGCIKKEQGLGSFCIAFPKKTRRLNIDVLINGEDIYFIPYVLKGISRVLEESSCNLLLHDTKDSAGQIRNVMRDILVKGTDGVILQPSTVEDTRDEELLEIVRQYKAAGIPIVTICGMIPGSSIMSLCIDDYYGAKVAARYLLDCGHRRIAGLFCEERTGTRLRQQGFRDTVVTAADAVTFEITEQSYEKELLRLIREEHITAVMCCNDRLGAESIRLILENGYRVPEDVSVTGFNNTELSLSTSPQLTTVVHPKDHLGSDAARMLLMMIATPEMSQSSVVYRPELVIRQSVATIL